MNGTAAERALTRSREIPSRRVLVNDPSLMPHDYSTTPGGTIFSTTPGGTRIIYERKFLLDLRNSPLSRTPPANLPSIPGVTCEDNGDTTIHEEENQKVPESPPVNKPQAKHGQEGEDDHQFQMEI